MSSRLPAKERSIVWSDLRCVWSGLVWSGRVWSGLGWVGLICVGFHVVSVAVLLFAVSMALQLLMMSVWQCLLARIVEVPSARCVHVSGVDDVAIVHVFCLAAIANTFGDAVASVARRRACRPGLA